ncbi:alpha/beta hydrolase [Pedobacter panaciterrae]|uniref:alpha/beta hydrolase n=1 Tax=Pedobacter panaciterrae TaxID=363849 RepID=UPI00155DA28D|nr:alpha/beta hydrolase [Pedobacter panaciterrae]NQX54429.1 alpha/beta hydrolase [Pedobacter panaciterrae]
MKVKLLILLFFIVRIASAQKVLPLYPDSVPNNLLKLSDAEQPTLTLYLPERRAATGTAVIIFPGGAYSFLAYEEEGISIAKEFVKKGIAAFVVKYRLPRRETMRDKSFGSLMDAQQAIKVVRSKAASWGIGQKRIGVIGYSAGGHLASTLGTHFSKSYSPNPENINLRPDFMILVYPLISMGDSLTHMGSRISLLGMEPSKERIELFSNELQVTKTTPPTYLTHAGDDSIVDVDNSIVFYQALQRKGVDAELHLFPKGNHGFTSRLSVVEWLDPMLAFIKREGFYEPK